MFSVLLLDSKHQLIEYRMLFLGTIDAAAFYPRKDVKLVLEHNAAEVIIPHNQASGVAERSTADKHITEKLKSALALIDVLVHDSIAAEEAQASFVGSTLI